MRLRNFIDGFLNKRPNQRPSAQEAFLLFPTNVESSYQAILKSTSIKQYTQESDYVQIPTKKERLVSIEKVPRIGQRTRSLIPRTESMEEKTEQKIIPIQKQQLVLVQSPQKYAYQKLKSHIEMKPIESESPNARKTPMHNRKHSQNPTVSQPKLESPYSSVSNVKTKQVFRNLAERRLTISQIAINIQQAEQKTLAALRPQSAVKITLNSVPTFAATSTRARRDRPSISNLRADDIYSGQGVVEVRPGTAQNKIPVLPRTAIVKP